MNKKFFSYFLLGCVIAWLIFSYIPETQRVLPMIGFPTNWQAHLIWLGGLAALAFFVIQFWLVSATVRTLQSRRTGNRLADQHGNPMDAEASPVDAPLRLRVSAEAFWTALPILMTLFLVLAGYRIWGAL